MGLEFRDAGIEARFEAYVDALGCALGHADRLAPFGDYVTGLLLQYQYYVIIIVQELIYLLDQIFKRIVLYHLVLLQILHV